MARRGIGTITVKALGGLVLNDAPASAGAHRLLWWLLWCRRPAERAHRLSCLGLRAGELEDYLLGARLPCDDIASRIGFLTGGAVRHLDWHRASTGGWCDMPMPRIDTQRRAA